MMGRDYHNRAGKSFVWAGNVSRFKAIESYIRNMTGNIAVFFENNFQSNVRPYLKLNEEEWPYFRELIKSAGYPGFVIESLGNIKDTAFLDYYERSRGVEFYANRYGSPRVLSELMREFYKDKSMRDISFLLNFPEEHPSLLRANIIKARALACFLNNYQLDPVEHLYKYFLQTLNQDYFYEAGTDNEKLREIMDSEGIKPLTTCEEGCYGKVKSLKEIASSALDKTGLYCLGLENQGREDYERLREEMGQMIITDYCKDQNKAIVSCNSFLSQVHPKEFMNKVLRVKDGNIPVKAKGYNPKDWF